MVSGACDHSVVERLSSCDLAAVSTGLRYPTNLLIAKFYAIKHLLSRNQEITDHVLCVYTIYRVYVQLGIVMLYGLSYSTATWYPTANTNNKAAIKPRQTPSRAGNDLPYPIP
jgi:hypothetical protein